MPMISLCKKCRPSGAVPHRADPQVCAVKTYCARHVPEGPKSNCPKRANHGGSKLLEVPSRPSKHQRTSSTPDLRRRGSGHRLVRDRPPLRIAAAGQHSPDMAASDASAAPPAPQPTSPSDGSKDAESSPPEPPKDGQSAPAPAPPATKNPAPTEVANMAAEPPELDDFGLPIKKFSSKHERGASVSSQASKGSKNSGRKGSTAGSRHGSISSRKSSRHYNEPLADSDTDGEFEDAVSGRRGDEEDDPRTPIPPGIRKSSAAETGWTPQDLDNPESEAKSRTKRGADEPAVELTDKANEKRTPPVDPKKAERDRAESTASNNIVSEFSHQQLTTAQPEKTDDDDGEWQEMPAYAPYDIYDDDNKLIAKEHDETADETYGYAGLGGAGKGYTRVLVDDDAESATSMDDNTNYLFKGAQSTSMMDEEETQRDAVTQLQATKDLLTEGQRIAYVGLTRLELSAMTKEAESIVYTRKTKKEVQTAAESMLMWSQKMMVRLYAHMDISQAEQVMIEQLSAHGVVPKDLTPVLMANARVKNPMADDESKSAGTGTLSPGPDSLKSPTSSKSLEYESPAEPPPPYSAEDDVELTAPVRTPSQLPQTEKIDIDLRWTVLCDLFLVLIADSIYDARSRVLLERVGQALEIPWIDICRFEKKVTDALEMQQNAEKENWNEDEHKENRRKMALKRRYVMMGLATVGGGLVIGLSAGLLAPVIGAGLAAGFTTIGVTGTSGFLAGAGGAAIITSSAAASGSFIGVKAANRRTGAVKTFEYRPLHNNKRVNLIVTVSGWMTGKVDDIRLPYSTVDPIMGDIYSVLWEPEMLTSMGDTINILATEALTQGLQQILGSTILVSLMAALQLPVVLTKLAYLIDNPWAVSLDRATMAGLILADSLIDRNLGTRPVTLVGYSLGSRVIFSCLLELAKKGAVGLVQNVYIFGSPVVVRTEEYLRARTVVSGRFLSGYNRNDWILGYLFRLTNGGIRRVGGLAPVENVPGLENMDCSEIVVGHMDYRTAMPRLLRECGWLVESDEFTEIEDPDPDNHQERQRELINEIEEARKEFEREENASKGGAFAFFRKKKQQRQEWEVYEDSSKEKGGPNAGGGKTEDKEGNNHGVLFDVDAIRAELYKEASKTGQNGAAADEMLQIKEIKSTLPPMRLPSPGLVPPKSPALTVRSRSSTDAQSPQGSRRPSHEYRQSMDSRTPTGYSFSTPGKGGNGYEAGGSNGYRNDGIEEDNGIQMTFDTSFDDTPQKPPPGPPKERTQSLNAVPTTDARSVSEPVRPGVKTAQTVPNIMLTDHWVDEEDEDFGKEKEISMTFA
ncbi:DUF726-domain-containing protein [Thozetella sp. PMI_491]|nr:DUF726-domain-containing protein [Thozetella sp. PMI_491]